MMRLRRRTKRRKMVVERVRMMVFISGFWCVRFRISVFAKLTYNCIYYSSKMDYFYYYSTSSLIIFEPHKRYNLEIFIHTIVKLRHFHSKILNLNFNVTFAHCCNDIYIANRKTLLCIFQMIQCFADVFETI